MRHTFPSPTFPPPPSVTLDSPPGFEPIDAPESIIGLIAPTSDAPFSPTIVVGWERLDRALNLEFVGRDTLQQASAAQQHYVLEEERTMTVEAHPAIARVQTFDEPRISRRLAQLVVLALVDGEPNRRTRELIHLTATCLADETDHWMPKFQTTVASLTMR